MGEKIVAWRDGNGKLSVMSALCLHRGVAVDSKKVAVLLFSSLSMTVFFGSATTEQVPFSEVEGKETVLP
jgi:hypothetical protein